MIDPEQGQTNYGYDALNRLHTITDFNGNLFTFVTCSPVSAQS